MITRKQATLESVTGVLRDPSMMFVLGGIMLVAGVAMVLAHNVWSQGALAVIVTLVGWMTLIKSLFFLFLPPELEARLFLRQLHYQELFYVYGAISLVLGVYRPMADSSQDHISQFLSEARKRGCLACSSTHRLDSLRVPVRMRRPAATR
jgi:hypothetical protein